MEINFGASKWGFDRKLYPILILLLMVFGAVAPAIVLLGIVIVLEKDDAIVKESIHATLAGFINTILSTVLYQGSVVISRIEFIVLQLVPDIMIPGTITLFQTINNVSGLFIAVILFCWTLYVINRGILPLARGRISGLPLRKLALAMYTKAAFDGFQDDIDMVKGDLRRAAKPKAAGVKPSQAGKGKGSVGAPVSRSQRSAAQRPVTKKRKPVLESEFDESDFDLDL